MICSPPSSSTRQQLRTWTRARESWGRRYQVGLATSTPHAIADQTISVLTPIGVRMPMCRSWHGGWIRSTGTMKPTVDAFSTGSTCITIRRRQALAATSNYPDDVAVFASRDSQTNDLLIMLVNQHEDADVSVTIGVENALVAPPRIRFFATAWCSPMGSSNSVRLGRSATAASR